MSHFVRCFEALEALETTPGRNDKLALLKGEKKNPVLKTLINWAYNGDNYHTYPDALPKSTKIGIPSQLADVGYKDTFAAFEKLLRSLRERAVTGNAAQTAVRDFFFKLNSLLYKWFHRVMHHDLRIGCNVSLFNQVWEGDELWPDRVVGDEADEFRYPGCQNSLEYVEWPGWGYGFVEPKFDGYRLSALVSARKVVFFSRQGHHEPYTTNLRVIAERLLDLGFKNCMVDGEILWGDSWCKTGGIKRKNPSPEQQAEIDANAIFHVFDWVPMDVTTGELLKPELTLETRRAELFKRIGNARTECVRTTKLWKVWGPKGLEEATRRARAMGAEGSMLKDPNSPYEIQTGSRRAPSWFKVKPVRDVTYKVVDFLEGTGRNEGRLGSFICENEKGDRVRVAGITDAEREKYWAMRKKLVGFYLDAKEQDQDGVAVSRHPQFLRWRDDRNPRVIPRYGKPEKSKAKTK